VEQVSRADPLTIVNQDATVDFMPETGPKVGYAVTVVISGGDPRPKREHPDNFLRYREYLASVPGPKIVVTQDLDHPRCHGSLWGEVGAVTARALGCVGTITDGAIRDLDEMKAAGFKALARRLAVSHAHCWPLRWGMDVEVFGTKVRPGQLLHADKHGFIVIPRDAGTVRKGGGMEVIVPPPSRHRPATGPAAWSRDITRPAFRVRMRRAAPPAKPS
jgi:regulator of RNase E activity RraA